jgi:ankyrin repeat protein
MKAYNSAPREVFRFLVEHGANVNRQNSQGKTVVHLAAARNDTESLELLSQYGADHRVKDCTGKTPQELLDG